MYWDGDINSNNSSHVESITGCKTKERKGSVCPACDKLKIE